MYFTSSEISEPDTTGVVSQVVNHVISGQNYTVGLSLQSMYMYSMYILFVLGRISDTVNHCKNYNNDDNAVYVSYCQI